MVSRGAEDNSARNGVWANIAYKEIVNAADWPFTFTAVTGGADTGQADVPLARKIIFVGDVSGDDTKVPGRKLHRITPAELMDFYGTEDFYEAGPAIFWYYEASAPSGTEQVVSFPSSGTLFVRYQMRATTLSGSDVPIFHADYHYLIVDRAMVEVLKDNHEWDEARTAMQFYKQQLAEMQRDLLGYAREGTYIDAGSPGDG
jgi:hypothetical protein